MSVVVNKIRRVCIIFYFIDSEWVACRLIERIVSGVRLMVHTILRFSLRMNASLIDDSLLFCGNGTQHG